MMRRRFVMDLRPGDTLVGDIVGADTPFHNGDPNVIETSVIRTAHETRYAVKFADGSITETPKGETVVIVGDM